MVVHTEQYAAGIYMQCIWDFLQCACTLLTYSSKNIHCVANVYAVLPFYNVKCLCSGGREWRREATPTSISIFDFYGIKTLWMNLVMIFSLVTKYQHFKLRGLQFHHIKWLKKGNFNFKVLAFWNQGRCHYQIQITRPLYQKN